MNTKAILTKGIGTVTFLFAAFGNFILDIAPPGESNSRLVVGIASMLVLFVLLFISAIKKNQPPKQSPKLWYYASVFFFVLAIMSSITYQSNLSNLTFPYPPQSQKAEYIKGTVLTGIAEQYSKEHPLKTTAEIVAAFGGISCIERVWTRESIEKAKRILSINYVILILSVATMLFCLTEGILATKR